jgi:hypothetical protein
MTKPPTHARPLLVSDCDDVLLHFASHFAEWIDEEHGLRFALDKPGFADAVSDREGRSVAVETIWPLLDGFFDSQMHRQSLVPGAIDALTAIGAVADIVILTNIGDHYRANRVAQLGAFDIHHRVLCNQGGKGRPVLELVDELQPSVTVFVDDLAVHHESVAKHVPGVWRLHMISEPLVAAHRPPATFAHARIDSWSEATPWIMDRFADGKNAEQGG